MNHLVVKDELKMKFEGKKIDKLKKNVAKLIIGWNGILEVVDHLYGKIPSLTVLVVTEEGRRRK